LLNIATEHVGEILWDLANLSQAVSEERNDMIMGFAEKYRSYKQKVSICCPVLWGVN
jgi:hypothetical protein